MRNFLFILLLMIAVPSFAQRVDKPGEPYDYFVTVMGFRNMSNKIRFEVSWPDGKGSRSIRDNEGKKIEFNTLTDILLYMSKRGWIYVSEFPDGSVVKFLFKKVVTSDEQAKEFFYFEEDFKK